MCDKVPSHGGIYDPTNSQCPKSIRQCILEINGKDTTTTPSISTITFPEAEAQAQADRTIKVKSALPAISKPVTIDGGEVGITLDGANLTPANGTSCKSEDIQCVWGSAKAGEVYCQDGLTVGAQNVTIQNMIVTNFARDGINIQGGSLDDPSHVKVVGGSVVDNCRRGINIAPFARSTTIKGSSKTNPIIITGNGGDGIYSAGPQTFVEDAWIGIGADQKVDGNNNGITFLAAAQDSEVKGVGNNTIVSGNRLHGISTFAMRTFIHGVYVGAGPDGASRRPNGGVGIFVQGTAGRGRIGRSVAGAGTAPTVVSGNVGCGVKVAGGGFLMVNTRVGVGVDGLTKLSNYGDGIDLLQTASLAMIGRDGAADNIVSGNKGDGIQLASQNVKISNTFIGIGANGFKAVGNGGHGIYAMISASGLQVGGSWISEEEWPPNTAYTWEPAVTTVVSSNGASGIFSAGASAEVVGVYVGIARDGRTRKSNQEHGIFLTKDAKNSQIGFNGPSGLTVVSGNSGSGVNSSAPGTSVFSALIGVDISGKKAVPNNKVGVVLMRPALNSHIGLAYNSTTVPPATVISGNKASGIVSDAVGTQVSNCRIGVGRDGFSAVPNAGAGVQFLSNAANSNVGDTSSGKFGEDGYTAGGKPFSFLSVISGNDGDGIRSLAKNTVVNNAHVGFALVVTENNSFYRRTPNTGAGLNFQASADSPRVGYRWPSERTVISGNAGNGVHSAAKFLKLGLCHVGVDPTGGYRLANAGNGVNILSTAIDPVIGHLRYGSPEAVDTQTVISGNGGNGVQSDAVKTFVYATYVGLDASGNRGIANRGTAGIMLTDDATDARIGLYTSKDFRNVISSNFGHGIQSSAARTTVSNSYIGLTTFGLSPLGNYGDGVALLTAASASRVGDERGSGSGAAAAASAGNKPPVIIGGNFGNGVSSNAVKTSVSNVQIGVGAETLGYYPSIPNQGTGVYFEHSAAGSTVGSTLLTPDRTVVGNNALHGIASDASSATVVQCHVGLDVLGKPAPNSGAGVHFGATAIGSIVGGKNTTTTIVSSNAGNGVQSLALRTTVRNVRIGTSPDMASSRPNGGSGVVLGETARHSFVGAEGVYHMTVIAFNVGDGIRCDAQNLVVKGCALGMLRDAPGVGSAATAAGNGGSGIVLSETASNATVTNSYIGSNQGDGIFAAAPNADLSTNYIGMNDGAVPAGEDETKYFGNFGFGVSGTGSAANLQLSDNLIGGNGLPGIRYDVEKGGSGDAFSSSNHVILTNGWGEDACTLCKCSTLAASTEAPGAIEVDCTVAGNDGPAAPSRSPTDRSVRDLGPSFPTALPFNTAVLDLGGVNLEMVDWEQIESLSDLRVLVLSDNPNLDPIPASGKFLPSASWRLQDLGLRGTDLRRVEDGTFAALGQSLETFDLSRPSMATPKGTEIKLTAFPNLPAVTWYSAACPAGYHVASSWVRTGGGSNSAESSSTLCIRCPVGTEKTAPGGDRKMCAPCSDGLHDHDNDPSTACSAGFIVLSFTRPSSAPTPVSGASYVQDPDDSSETYAVGQVYQIGPVTITSVENSIASETLFTYSMEGSPPGFEIDSATGEISGAPEATGLYRISLYAFNERMERALVEQFTFDVESGCSAGSMSSGTAVGITFLGMVLVLAVLVGIAMQCGWMGFACCKPRRSLDHNGGAGTYGMRSMAQTMGAKAGNQEFSFVRGNAPRTVDDEDMGPIDVGHSSGLMSPASKQNPARLSYASPGNDSPLGFSSPGGSSAAPSPTSPTNPSYDEPGGYLDVNTSYVEAVRGDGNDSEEADC